MNKRGKVQKHKIMQKLEKNEIRQRKYEQKQLPINVNN